FDGHSLICNPRGNLAARAPQFEEALLVADLDLPERPAGGEGEGPDFEAFELPPCGAASAQTPSAERGGRPQPQEELLAAPLEEIEEARQALVRAIGDYARKNGFHEVALGLSGGVDSALAAALAAEAVGADRVLGVAMPTRYTSLHSLEDARLLAENLGIRYLEIDIDPIFQGFLDALGPVFAGRPADVAEENLQPRIRGMLLMAISNKLGSLVLTAGNKSEASVGYSTLYGDTAGGFAALKDVSKTLVYELCRHINAEAGWDLIPRRILEKPPSAELRPDQKDTDTLPPYEVLDPILAAYVEEGAPPSELTRRGFDAATVRRVTEMVDRSEYKR